MNNREAIKCLKDRRMCAEYVYSDYCDCFDLEAVKIAIEALEKQTPKKFVIIDGNDCCPSCNYIFGADIIRKKLHHWDIPFCQKCGQRLDWDNCPF